MTTSMLTGQLPSLHGVTAAAWKETRSNEVVDAYSTEHRSSSMLSVFDLFKVQHESNVHVVGAATRETLAKAMTTNAYGASYFDTPEHFTSDHKELNFGWEDLLQSMTNDQVWKDSAESV